jgi:hypothetical protein
MITSKGIWKLTDGVNLAAGSHGPSPVLLAVFLLGGLVALWCGVGWAAMGRQDGSPTLFATPGHLRFLGAVGVGAGSGRPGRFPHGTVAES